MALDAKPRPHQGSKLRSASSGLANVSDESKLNDAAYISKYKSLECVAEMLRDCHRDTTSVTTCLPPNRKEKKDCRLSFDCAGLSKIRFATAVNNPGQSPRASTLSGMSRDYISTRADNSDGQNLK